MLQLGRNYSTNSYTFGFNGKLMDDEMYNVTGSSYDYGARIYSPGLIRWWSVDPLAKKYAPISPYAYALNSPIIFIDSDGRVVIGVDGNPVTYTKGTDGVVTWSENASADVIEVGNAMLSTSYGEKSFNRWQDADTKINLVIDRENVPTDGRLGQTDGNPNKETGERLNEDGQFIEAKVTFYKKSIDNERAEGSGKRLEGAGWEESLGTVGVHEEGHNDPNQIWRDDQADIQGKKELDQNPKKNLPINSEINFRKEYNEKNPGTNPKFQDNLKKYDDNGYKGLNEKGKPIKK